MSFLDVFGGREPEVNSDSRARIARSCHRFAHGASLRRGNADFTALPQASRSNAALATSYHGVQIRLCFSTTPNEARHSRPARLLCGESI